MQVQTNLKVSDPTHMLHITNYLIQCSYHFESLVVSQMDSYTKPFTPCKNRKQFPSSPAPIATTHQAAKSNLLLCMASFFQFKNFTINLKGA